MNRFFSSMIQELRVNFALGNALTRIILVNLVVWIVANVIWLILQIPAFGGILSFDTVARWFSVSADWKFNLFHPWVLVTHAFFHHSFMHLFWNLITLMWAGRIVGDLLGDRRVLPVYLLSAFAGALVFFLQAQFILNLDGYAYGASAAAMGLLLTAAVAAPDYPLNLMLIGEVKLKYVAALLVFLDVIAVAGSVRFSGGSLAHLGGAAMGAFYMSRLQNGIDLGKPLMRLLEKIDRWWNNRGAKKGYYGRQQKTKFETHRNPNYNRSENSNTQNKGHQAPPDPKQLQLDAILDKIKQSGYDSLTAEEKEFLFNASK